MAQSVLVVEDTELLRRMYADRLKLDGFDVLTAADGLEAMATLREATPDLILLDLIMPMMSGLEVLERIQNDSRLRNVPVLILSNLGDDTDIRRGIEMGAVDYLIKNDSRPADISARIGLILRSCDSRSDAAVYRLALRDRDGDADRFIADACLPRRFWCPACEVELSLELTPIPDANGHYDAHMVCLMCGREY